MSYIIECRINSKERIIEVDDLRGQELQKQWLTNAMPIKILINSEALPSQVIQLISPSHVWWQKDKIALSQRGKQRCAYCHQVLPFGTQCFCKPKNALPEPKREDVPVLSDDRLRAGWIRAIKAAVTANPKINTRLFDSLTLTYAIAPEEVGLPANAW